MLLSQSRPEITGQSERRYNFERAANFKRADLNARKTE